MFFYNTKESNNRFFTENSSVLDSIERRVKKHGMFVSEYISGLFNKCAIKEFGKDMFPSRPVSGETDERVEFLKGLAIPSDETKALVESEISRTITSRMGIRKSFDFEAFVTTPTIVGVDVYGDISRYGEHWRKSLPEEMKAKYYTNTVLNRKVFDIDNLVYVSWVYDNFTDGTQRGAYDSIFGIDICARALVEIDALLIRYASTLPEDELEILIDSICIMVTEKLCRLFASQTVFAKLLKAYASPMVSSTLSSNSNNNNINEKFSPKLIFMALLVSKVVCDSVNNVPTSNDSKDMDEIIDLADLSLRNAGTIYGLGKAASLVFSKLNISKHKKRYLESYMDAVVEYVEQHKGDIVRDLNRTGHFTFNFNPRFLHKTINRNNRLIGVESCRGLECWYSYADQIYRVEDAGLAMFNIVGMESNSNLDAYKKNTRRQLLMMLSDKERMSYTKFENMIMRYRSDAINCKDDSRKNTLLTRSKGLGRILALEISRSKTDCYTELLASLDDERYVVDSTLSARDFTRERNTRMYGQVVGTDWDY